MQDPYWFQPGSYYNGARPQIGRGFFKGRVFSSPLRWRRESQDRDRAAAASFVTPTRAVNEGRPEPGQVGAIHSGGGIPGIPGTSATADPRTSYVRNDEGTGGPTSATGISGVSAGVPGVSSSTVPGVPGVQCATAAAYLQDYATMAYPSQGEDSTKEALPFKAPYETQTSNTTYTEEKTPTQEQVQQSDRGPVQTASQVRQEGAFQPTAGGGGQSDTSLVYVPHHLQKSQWDSGLLYDSDVLLKTGWGGVQTPSASTAAVTPPFFKSVTTPPVSTFLPPDLSAFPPMPPGMFARPNTPLVSLLTHTPDTDVANLASAQVEEVKDSSLKDNNTLVKGMLWGCINIVSNTSRFLTMLLQVRSS